MTYCSNETPCTITSTSAQEERAPRVRLADFRGGLAYKSKVAARMSEASVEVCEARMTFAIDSRPRIPPATMRSAANVERAAARADDPSIFSQAAHSAHCDVSGKDGASASPVTRPSRRSARHCATRHDAQDEWRSHCARR